MSNEHHAECVSRHDCGSCGGTGNAGWGVRGQACEPCDGSGRNKQECNCTDLQVRDTGVETRLSIPAMLAEFTRLWPGAAWVVVKERGVFAALCGSYVGASPFDADPVGQVRRQLAVERGQVAANAAELDAFREAL